MPYKGITLGVHKYREGLCVSVCPSAYSSETNEPIHIESAQIMRSGVYGSIHAHIRTSYPWNL